MSELEFSIKIGHDGTVVEASGRTQEQVEKMVKFGIDSLMDLKNAIGK